MLQVITRNYYFFIYFILEIAFNSEKRDVFSHINRRILQHLHKPTISEYQVHQKSPQIVFRPF